MKFIFLNLSVFSQFCKLFSKKFQKSQKKNKKLVNYFKYKNFFYKKLLNSFKYKNLGKVQAPFFCQLIIK